MLGERAADRQPAYLSGLLIGAEIADALRVFGGRSAASGATPLASPTIVASASIAGRYRRALLRAGVDAQIADGASAAPGLFAIAFRSGLLA